MSRGRLPRRPTSRSDRLLNYRMKLLGFQRPIALAQRGEKLSSGSERVSARKPGMWCCLRGGGPDWPSLNPYARADFGGGVFLGLRFLGEFLGRTAEAFRQTNTKSATDGLVPPGGLWDQELKEMRRIVGRTFLQHSPTRRHSTPLSPPAIHLDLHLSPPTPPVSPGAVNSTAPGTPLRRRRILPASCRPAPTLKPTRRGCHPRLPATSPGSR
jgi:hypothetical protein